MTSSSLFVSSLMVSMTRVLEATCQEMGSFVGLGGDLSGEAGVWVSQIANKVAEESMIVRQSLDN
ncbi:unnamed protein product [Fusarium venenatum]|uniref:Uncharacterized protein n=1 Tax=Fusarium venenatum TaxID=56646 RepID=A0A2L2TH79_9HYPO|nr:uncharacterized protein FVRRES_09535 [Fusarium venenatum]CEI69458.1 unnamed protein product [Fusarium venenatum]